MVLANPKHLEWISCVESAQKPMIAEITVQTICEAAKQEFG
jgi:hypothetical protein